MPDVPPNISDNDAVKSEKKFDLVLSDVMMPVMDGPTFIIEARKLQEYKNIPIVMMSTNDQYDKVFECISNGADDYMPKPLAAETLKNIYINDERFTYIEKPTYKGLEFKTKYSLIYFLDEPTTIFYKLRYFLIKF